MVRQLSSTTNFRSDIAAKQNWHLTIISDHQPGQPPLEEHFSDFQCWGMVLQTVPVVLRHHSDIRLQAWHFALVVFPVFEWWH